MNTMYRDHFFYMINVASNLKCCQKDDISKCTVPLRGVPGVHCFFFSEQMKWKFSLKQEQVMNRKDLREMHINELCKTLLKNNLCDSHTHNM